ncbi:MAG: hypothetical protein IPP49_17475 [Saprospiraceae bacterium]|nr:hypothetical protein [Saprospiraceae bacterium]
MKIGGLGTPEMEYLWENLSSKYRYIDAFIVAEEYNNDDRYITATKLIELRNQGQTHIGTYPLTAGQRLRILMAMPRLKKSSWKA